MFSHLIYYRNDVNDIYGWDPATDMLVSPSGFLLWRHVRQTVPNSTHVYGGVVVDRSYLSVVRFSHDLYFDGVDEWMKTGKKPFGGRRLGFHAQSRYRSILRPLAAQNPHNDLQQRIKLINEFLSEYNPFSEPHQPWRWRQLDGSTPAEKWAFARRVFIDHCLNSVASAA